MGLAKWSDINVGDVVLDRHGKEWTVDKVDNDVVALTRPGGHWAGNVHGTVERVATREQVAERALAVAQVRLGGQVVAVGDRHRGHSCPTTYPDTGSLAAHLHLFHGVGNWEQQETYATLTARHNNLHATGTWPHEGSTPHWHNPAFYRELT